MLDDNGKTEGWGWIAVLVRNEERERKKANGRWVRGDETLLQYVQRETAQAKCIKGHENTHTHCQHAIVSGS